MKNIILKLIPFLAATLILSSCKLKSFVSPSEFTGQNDLNNITGIYLLPPDTVDVSSVRNRRIGFEISDIVKGIDRDLLENKTFDRIGVFFDGKNRITFRLFEGDKSLDFTYKCESKDNYLEIYFKKRRIWALPLFMSYEYDRLRLGLSENSDLIIHKWNVSLFTLTIMPFDSFGGKDYRQEFTRLEE